MIMETAAKLNYFPAKGGCLNYFSQGEILHHVKINYKMHCSAPLLSYILTHDESTLTNTDHAHALDRLFLHTVHMMQGEYECYHIPLTEFRQPLQVQSHLEMPGILVQLGHTQRT